MDGPPAISLTLALLGLALAVLLALALHGWWAARRARPRGGSLAARGDRMEPALDGSVPASAPFAGEPGSAGVEPAARSADGIPGEGEAHPADPSGTPGTPPLRPAPRRASVRLDALIDALVPLTLDAPVSGEAVLAALPPVRRAGSKPYHVEGLDTETGTWEPLQPGRRYGELQAGVQMVNRAGALNEIGYSEFVQQVQALAELLGARAEPPDMLEVVARARELDALTAPLDAQLALTLRANGPAWAVPYVQQVAQRAGFVPGTVPGRFVLPAAEKGAPPLLVLTVQARAALAALAAEPGPDAGADPAADPAADKKAQAALAALAGSAAVRECVLLLDLPQSAESAEAYPAWHRTATHLADELDATAVDEQGQPITLHAFSAIAQQVAQVYERLQALDLPAGSPAARRLFS
jgi:hypothetical protein